MSWRELLPKTKGGRRRSGTKAVIEKKRKGREGGSASGRKKVSTENRETQNDESIRRHRMNKSKANFGRHHCTKKDSGLNFWHGIWFWIIKSHPTRCAYIIRKFVTELRDQKQDTKNLNTMQPITVHIDIWNTLAIALSTDSIYRLPTRARAR